MKSIFETVGWRNLQLNLLKILFLRDFEAVAQMMMNFTQSSGRSLLYLARRDGFGLMAITGALYSPFIYSLPVVYAARHVQRTAIPFYTWMVAPVLALALGLVIIHKSNEAKHVVMTNPMAFTKESITTSRAGRHLCLLWVWIWTPVSAGELFT